MPTSLTIALDWTPNTNHTSFFVGQARSLYPDLSLEFLSPSSDAYSISPAKKVLSGAADIALVPSESILAHQDSGRAQLVAVAALLAKDASAIVALKSRNFSTPADLEDKVYASYNAKYEDELVKQLIINGGGKKGGFRSETPARLNIWPELVEGKVDFTWVFLPWEGVQASRKGIELSEFVLGDYGIEYGYSPVLAVERSWLDRPENQTKLRAFLSGTRQAVDWTIDNSDEAAEILVQANRGEKDLDDVEFVKASQKMVAAFYKDGDSWGGMKESKWKAFVESVGQVDKTFRCEDVDVSTLHSNEYL